VSAPAVSLSGVTKRYRRMAAGFRLRTLKSALVERSLVGGLRPEETITALEGVSLEIGRGEAFGVIGSNGSGKSTLLKLIAGILQPTSGRVAVDGRVAALIELGAGFHPEISGRENIYINGSVHGLSRRQIDRLFDEIVAFSGLEEFIEEPVKTYSSGMWVRLGFAVAIHTEPDVLLVDEVLAVGDEAFAHRCLRRVEELLAEGRTVLFVSHSLGLVESFCDRVLWLDRGRVLEVGAPRQVADQYRQAVAEDESEAHQAAKNGAEHTDSARWGSGEAMIVSARLLVAGREHYHLKCGEPAAVELEVDAREPLEDFVFGIGISTPRGVEVWGTNTDLEGYRAVRLAGVARVRIDCPNLQLAPGEYRVDLAVHGRDGAPFDFRKGLFSFSVTADHETVGVYAPEHRWSFDGDVDLRLQPAGGPDTD